MLIKSISLEILYRFMYIKTEFKANKKYFCTNNDTICFILWLCNYIWMTELQPINFFNHTRS